MNDKRENKNFVSDEQESPTEPQPVEVAPEQTSAPVNVSTDDAKLDAYAGYKHVAGAPVKEK